MEKSYEEVLRMFKLDKDPINKKDVNESSTILNNIKSAKRSMTNKEWDYLSKVGYYNTFLTIPSGYFKRQ